MGVLGPIFEGAAMGKLAGLDNPAEQFINTVANLGSPASISKGPVGMA